MPCGNIRKVGSLYSVNVADMQLQYRHSAISLVVGAGVMHLRVMRHCPALANDWRVHLSELAMSKSRMLEGERLEIVIGQA